MDNVKEDLTAQGMNMREAMDNNTNRKLEVGRDVISCISLQTIDPSLTD